MIIVVNNTVLQKMIRLVREDKTPKLRGENAPFLRIAAHGENVSVAGHQVSATFAATVYEEGVIFLRTTLFRKLLATFTNEPFLTIQVNDVGLHMGDTYVSFDRLEMVLFPIVEQAPNHWPPPLPEREQPKPTEKSNTLFDFDGEK